MSNVVSGNGFESTVELQGECATLDREPNLGRLPRLPRGRPDWLRLATIPYISLADLATATGADGRTEKQTTARRDHANPFERMRLAGYELRAKLGRPIGVDELVQHYTERYAHIATVNESTVRRAKEVCLWLDNNWHDDGGYQKWRKKLIEAVGTHCVDRTNRPRRIISDELLAAVAYCIAYTSDRKNEMERRQNSVPNAAIAGLLERIRSDDVEQLPTTLDHTLISATKQILERTGMILCTDQNYVPSGKKYGIGKKYVAGPMHPMYVTAENTSIPSQQELGISIVWKDSRVAGKIAA